MIISPRGRPRRALWPWALTVFSLLMISLRAWAQWGPAGSSDQLIAQFGFVPARVMSALGGLYGSDQWMEVLRLLTALFVHGDWLHLAGNLAYLWAFGITVERAIGHWGAGLVFLLLGVLANLFLTWRMANAQLPVIGASGGVSALIGMYLGLFPVSRMGLWLPLGVYLQFARVPSILVIGSWFTLQLIYSVFMPGSGAVGWWAHIGGFVAGLVLAALLRPLAGFLSLSLQDD